MNFPYQSYLTNLFVIPTLLFITGIFCLVFSLIPPNKIDNILKRITTKKCIKYILLKTVILVLSIVFTILPLHNLYWGIHLIIEKPDSFEMCTGKVMAITKDSLSPRYYDEDGKILRASIVKINNLDYYFMSADELTVGDVINISYLPQSSIVLSYYYSSEIGLPERREISNNENKDLFFVIGFDILFLVAFVLTRKEKYFMLDNSGGEWSKNEVKIKKGIYIKGAFLNLGVLFFGMIISFLSQNYDALFVAVLFVCLSSCLIILSNKNDYFVYDDNGITVSSINGKKCFIMYSQVKSIENTLESKGNRATYQIMIINYYSDKSKKQEKLKYQVYLYNGVNRFLEYMKNHSVRIIDNLSIHT